MIIGIPEILLGLAVVILPIACVTNWVAALKQYQNGEPLVPTEYRENAPWGLLDLGVIVAIVGLVGGMLVQMIAKAVGIQDPSLTDMMVPEDRGRLFQIFGGCTIAATILAYGWIGLRYWRLCGFSKYHIGPDIELGMRWFVMLVVPVLLIQVGLTRIFESNHPLTDMLRLTKSSSLLRIAAFSAIVAAPFFEESFFRLFLQGWLEKLEVTATRNKLGLGSQADTNALLVGGESSASYVGPPNPEPQRLVEEDGNPYQAPTSNGTTFHGSGSEHDEPLEDDVEERPVMWVPILVSSGLFSLAHLQHGPDWVPLFVLALGLGYLYQRTQRILPCLVVHMMFNGLAILQMWSHIRQ